MLPTTRPVLLAVFLIGLLCNCGEDQHSPPPAKAPAKDSFNTLPVQIRAPSLDKSVLDMAYCPEEYPILKMSRKVKTLPIARVIYSRPLKDGRVIFGGVIKYGQPWRLGANEATELELFRDVTIMDQKVKKGRYVMYCIPYENKWTIVLNNDLFTWGLKINEELDEYRFDVPITHINLRYEVFTMEFETLKKGFTLNMAWDNVHASLPIDE